MKIKLTTENRHGLNQEILAEFAEKNIDVTGLEVKNGLTYIETEPTDNSLSRTLASALMNISGVKWVESVETFPSIEQSLFLSTLINAFDQPVFGLNNKGEIVYQNQVFEKSFANRVKTNSAKLHIKDLFISEDWSKKLDVAASAHLPVPIDSVIGSLLVEVQPLNHSENKIHGALVVLHTYEQITAQSLAIENSEIKPLKQLISTSEKMQDVIERAQQMTNTQLPLVLYGEAGVGKKSLAQGIHQDGKRKNHLFSTVDCSALSPQQIEIEIFGSFNHDEQKPGLLKICNGGTLFIDSIQDMPKSCQKRLLVFLQTSSYQSGNEEVSSDVRIIASSSDPLKKQAEKGLFDKQLFYTLDVMNISIPPLRERKEDIEDLAQLFLQTAKQQTGKNDLQLSPSALRKITSYFWPGNLNQLKNTVFEACLQCNDSLIEPEHIKIDNSARRKTSSQPCSLPQATAEFEKQFLQQWYEKYPSTRKLAMHLGVSHTTIAQKLKKHGIN